MATRSPTQTHSYWGSYATGSLPASSNVQVGDTAFDTTLVALVVCTSTGPVAWAAVGGGGITQLTQDVLAGPGSGSQVATVQGMGGTTSKTHFVIEGGTIYASLQAAVDAASANDVIMVGPKSSGDWGNVLLNVVNKPLIIAAMSGAGANKVVKIGSVTYSLGTTGPALNVNLNEVYLYGLYIQGAFAGGSAVTLTGGANYPGRLRLYGCYVLNTSATGAAAVTNSNQGANSSLYLDSCVVALENSAAGHTIVQTAGYTLIKNRSDVSGSAAVGATGNAINVSAGTVEIYDSFVTITRANGAAIAITGGTTYVSAAYSTISNASNAINTPTPTAVVTIGTSGATFAAGDASLTLGTFPGPAAGVVVTGVGGGVFAYGHITYSYSTAISVVTASPASQEAATNDLSGNYPAPTVARIQNRAVSAAAPVTGQVLVWNGTAWTPTAPSAVTASGVIDFALNGSSPVSTSTFIGAVYIPSARTLAATSRAYLGVSGANQSVTLTLQTTAGATVATFTNVSATGFVDVTVTGAPALAVGWHNIVLTAGATAGMTAFARGLYLTV